MRRAVPGGPLSAPGSALDSRAAACPAREILRFLVLSVPRPLGVPAVKGSFGNGHFGRSRRPGPLPLGLSWTDCSPDLGASVLGLIKTELEVNCEMWILTTAVWENRGKEFPAESGRGGALRGPGSSRKTRSSQQPPEGPAFAATPAGVGPRARLSLRALSAASRAVA